MADLSHQRLQSYLHTLKGAEIAVIGDVMLDRYYWGTVSRVSPEAPVPVVDVDRETAHLGGAANVATNLLGLGASPLLIGAIGRDTNGILIKDLCSQAGLSAEYLVHVDDRPTTTKTRVIGNGQQIARVDHESKSYIEADPTAQILERIASRERLRGIILEDYDKGLLSPSMIRAITEHAISRDIPVFVDPKRRHFLDFRHCTVFKPNRKEVSDALGVSLRTLEDVQKVGAELLERLACESVLITLGAEGMMLMQRDTQPQRIPTRARKVSDVSGAGDTTIATLAAMVCSGASVAEAATLANVAAGYVVGEPGIVAITSEILSAAVSALSDEAES